MSGCKLSVFSLSNLGSYILLLSSQTLYILTECPAFVKMKSRLRFDKLNKGGEIHCILLPITATYRL